MQEMPRILKAGELMAHLRISRTTFDKVAQTIPGAFKVGREWRFPLTQVQAWEASGGTASEGRQHSENR